MKIPAVAPGIVYRVPGHVGYTSEGVGGLPALSFEAFGDVLHVAPAVARHIQSLVQV